MLSFNFPPVFFLFFTFYCSPRGSPFFHTSPFFLFGWIGDGNLWYHLLGMWNSETFFHLIDSIVLFMALIHSFLLFLDVTLLLEKRGGFSGSHTSCTKHFPSLVSKKNLSYKNLWVKFDAISRKMVDFLNKKRGAE